LTSPITSNVWIPVCCERVMRFNVFIQKDSSAYGALVCSVCNKNVALELEPTVDLAAYGDGARAINVLGSPRPPKTERRKADDGTLSDQTL
jgi:hypothetical protein